MKTTLEIPDSLFRRAKARAAENGQTLTRLISEALADKLSRPTAAAKEKPWMRFAGAFKSERAESRRILRRIDAEFETVESEDRE